MCVVGITGSVATGKSLVAEAFRRRGARILSADALARQVTSPGSPALRQIADEFGEQVIRPDGTLDRAAVAARVFRDTQARQRLEAIVHPPVLKQIRTEIEAHRNLRGDDEVLIVEVPLLFEVGIADWFDRIIVVAATREQQIARAMARDGLTAEEVEHRVAAQMPIEEKIAAADVVIWNTGTPEDLEREVEKLWSEICGGERSRRAAETHSLDACT